MNDRGEEKLEEEQEEILLKFLQTMPDSQETILTQEDSEQIAKNDIFFERIICCRKEERTVFTESEEVPYISGDMVKNYRGNATKSQWKTKNSLKNELGEEENDSGFATSSEQFLKVATPENFREDSKLIHEEEMDSDLLSDSEDSCASVESVSLLQNPAFTGQLENGENGESCVNIAWNIKLFPPIPCDEEDMQVDEERVHSVDESVQTVRFFSQSDEYIEKGSDFLRSVIHLKYIVLSGKDAPSKKYQDLLKSSNRTKEILVTSSAESVSESDEMDGEEWSFHCHEFEDFQSSLKVEGNREDIISQGIVNHVIRTMNAEDVMQRSMESILFWLKNEMKKNCKHFYNFWHDSIRADSVDIINEVVDLYSGYVRTRVSQFLIEIFDEIYESDSPVEDIILEYKIAFLSCFRKSVLLSHDLIEHVSRKLLQLTKPQPINKFQTMSLIKRSYFSLRLMEDLLRSFLAHLQTEGLQSIFCRKSPSPDEEVNVLNLWKTNCRGSDSSKETDASQMHVKYINVMAQWCYRTDQVLSFCLKEIPLLSKPAHACSLLAQDIIFFQCAMLK